MLSVCLLDGSTVRGFHTTYSEYKEDMNVLKVIEQKTLGGDDLSTHLAGENEPQPGYCHDGPGHGLAMRIFLSKVYAMRRHLQKTFACDR